MSLKENCGMSWCGTMDWWSLRSLLEMDMTRDLILIRSPMCSGSELRDAQRWDRMALPPVRGGSELEIDCHRQLAIHLIGSHVIGDIQSSPFCNEVTRRLQTGDHSAFDTDLLPLNIINRRIDGYQALRRDARTYGLSLESLLPNNHFSWNKTLVKALTLQGRAGIMNVLLRHPITAT
jgi:hypothetical protein